MPRVPILPARKIIRALLRLGFYIDHQKGSHIVLKDKLTKTITVVVPNHTQVDRGTLKSILKYARVDLETFLNELIIIK